MWKKYLLILFLCPSSDDWRQYHPRRRIIRIWSSIRHLWKRFMLHHQSKYIRTQFLVSDWLGGISTRKLGLAGIHIMGSIQFFLKIWLVFYYRSVQKAHKIWQMSNDINLFALVLFLELILCHQIANFGLSIILVNIQRRNNSDEAAALAKIITFSLTTLCQKYNIIFVDTSGRSIST